jgi:hypothetical protein
MNQVNRPMLMGLSLLFACGSFAAAQDAATPASIPQVLQITREYLKPYKAGQAHDKTESAFIASMAKAKFPAYYVGLNSMSGKSRALYLTQYPSFAEWEKDNKLIEKDASLGGELERNGLADGELLDSLDSVVYVYNPELSYHPRADVSHAHFMEIIVFKVKAGHRKDWYDLTKMVKDANEKGGTISHWATFEIAYGAPNDTYIALTSHKSMSDIDTGFAESKKFAEGMGGEEGMKKFDELYGATVESMRTELFSINPRQSYVNDAWIKADPDFWQPKQMPEMESKKSKK